MAIRKMVLADIDAVSALCMAAFDDTVAPTVSTQGSETFRKLASTEAFRQRLEGDNVLLVFEEGETLKGMIELKEGRHLTLLFVSPQHQRQGIGQALIAAMSAYARATDITVRASLTSVPAYLRYGFQCTGDADEAAGLSYQPMVLRVVAKP